MCDLVQHAVLIQTKSRCLATSGVTMQLDEVAMCLADVPVELRRESTNVF